MAANPDTATPPLKAATDRPTGTPPGEPKKPTVDPNAPEPKAWSFRYIGPVSPFDDRGCELCNAASMKSCPKDAVRHGSNPGGCATCYTARVGFCPNHCGLAKAIAEHTIGGGHTIHPEHQPAWNEAAKMVMTYVGLLPKDVKRVDVFMHADQDQPEMPFARVGVHIVAHK